MAASHETDIIWCINLMEKVIEAVPVTDWHDEWKSRVEDAEEMRDCIETVIKRLIASKGVAREMGRTGGSHRR